MKKRIKNRINEFEAEINERLATKKSPGFERFNVYFSGCPQSRNSVYMTTEITGEKIIYGYDFYVVVNNMCVFSSWSSKNATEAFKKMRNEFYRFIKKTKKEFIYHGFCDDPYIDTLDELKSVIEG